MEKIGERWKDHWFYSVCNLGSICYSGCLEQKTWFVALLRSKARSGCHHYTGTVSCEVPPPLVWVVLTIALQTMGYNRLNVYLLQYPPLIILDQAIELLLQQHPPIAPVPAQILHGLQSLWGCTCSCTGLFTSHSPSEKFQFIFDFPRVWYSSTGMAAMPGTHTSPDTCCCEDVTRHSKVRQ